MSCSKVLSARLSPLPRNVGNETTNTLDSSDCYRLSQYFQQSLLHWRLLSFLAPYLELDSCRSCGLDLTLPTGIANPGLIFPHTAGARQPSLLWVKPHVARTGTNFPDSLPARCLASIHRRLNTPYSATGISMVSVLGKPYFLG